MPSLLDDECCVVRRMVEALAPDHERAEIKDQMDETQQQLHPDSETSPFEKRSWREVGVAPRMVFGWCQLFFYPGTILHGSKACDVYPAEGGKPLVGCW